jgi:hypothetical protein
MRGVSEKAVKLSFVDRNAYLVNLIQFEREGGGSQRADDIRATISTSVGGLGTT